MKRILLALLVIFAIALSLLFIRQYSSVATIPTSGCIDIPAVPDYLSTGSAQDAIASLNNARQLEHLPMLNLPTNFYQLDPAQQQFLLLNSERTGRGLRPVRMDANLAQIALGYSKQLRNLKFFSHTSPIGGTFTDRMNINSSIANHYSQAAENIAGNPVAGIGAIYEYMYDDSVENCAHRYNILNPTLTLVGVRWVAGSAYGSISAQEYLTSASWRPYLGTILPKIAPQLTIAVKASGKTYMLQCLARTATTIGAMRITWFIDHVDAPFHVGAHWTLDTRHLSPGKHTLFAYAVDGVQNYWMAKYTIVV